MSCIFLWVELPCCAETNSCQTLLTVVNILNKTLLNAAYESDEEHDVHYHLHLHGKLEQTSVQLLCGCF